MREISGQAAGGCDRSTPLFAKLMCYQNRSEAQFKYFPICPVWSCRVLRNTPRSIQSEHRKVGMPAWGSPLPAHEAFPQCREGNMRKFTMAACAAGLAIALGTGVALSAQASSVIVVGPGQSIQAAINAARPGDTVFVRPGVYHQSVQIRTNGITVRGSGACARLDPCWCHRNTSRRRCATAGAVRRAGAWRRRQPRPGRLRGLERLVHRPDQVIAHSSGRVTCVEDCWHTGGQPGIAIRGDR